MKKTKTAVLAALAWLAMAPLLVGTASRLAYNGNRAQCEQPVPVSELEQVGLAIPDGAMVCHAEKRPNGALFRLVVARPSFLCLATLRAIGCPSLGAAGLSFVGPMRDAGWGTGSHLAPTGASATFDFERGPERAHLALRKSRFDEITGSFELTVLRKGKRTEPRDED